MSSSYRPSRRALAQAAFAQLSQHQQEAQIESQLTLCRGTIEQALLVLDPKCDLARTLQGVLTGIRRHSLSALQYDSRLQPFGSYSPTVANSQGVGSSDEKIPGQGILSEETLCMERTMLDPDEPIPSIERGIHDLSDENAASSSEHNVPGDRMTQTEGEFRGSTQTAKKRHRDDKADVQPVTKRPRLLNFWGLF
ncbi:hypothetical protein ACHAPJ_009631 [Fusarium lateritium]